MTQTPLANVLVSPSVARNRDPILAVLREILPSRGTVLEIASGTGEHALHVATALPDLLWQPSDPDPLARESIAAYRAAAALPNLLSPLALDASLPSWPIAQADAVVAINMIHIAPWAATHGLMAGAGRVLPTGGPLYLYGPFTEGDVPTAPSNTAFDRSLRERDPAWGLRDLGDVVAIATAHGLDLVQRVAMPANNLSLVFRRR